jgi:hypothetical protein
LFASRFIAVFAEITLKYSNLHHQAKHIDHLIDHTLHVRGTLFLQREDLKNLVLSNFPDFYMVSFGWHKIVFGIRSLGEKLVLKVGSKRSIENDHRAYKRLPEGIRHKLFARIFWHTKYCLLQEYGFPAHVTNQQLDYVRGVVYRYGVYDIKAANLKAIDGKLKIIDANATTFTLPAILRIVDTKKSKFPKKLVSLTRKITNLRYQR